MEVSDIHFISFGIDPDLGILTIFHTLRFYVGAPSQTRTGTPLRATDFLTTTIFIASIELFVVWTISAPSSQFVKVKTP